MKFEELGLSEPILRAVAAEQYTVATPIQVQGIPHVLKGSDLLGCAQTGTGKTAAFALPILHRLSQSKAGAKAEAAHAPQARPHGHGAHGAHASNGHRDRGHRDHPTTAIRALILAPTRELASQIAESFATYGRNLSLKHTVVFGGVSQVHQVRALRRGVDIVIATPGRLLDLMNQGYVDLRSIEILVLDEADRMLDMGFIHDIRKIVSRIPTHPHRQTLMFSATMPEDIRELAHSILRHPVNVKVSPVSSTVETIAQSVYFVPRKNKHALLRHLLQNAGMNRTLVFTRTKHGADKVVKGLLDSNIRAEAIHGNKSQNARTRALDSFKGNKPPVLVATDIASRGIDVDNITHVVNFDIPNVPETYVHRIGRTARAGARGVAISFCDPAEERGDLKAIERLIRQNIDVNTERLTFAPPPPHAPAPRAAHAAPAESHARRDNGHAERSHHRHEGSRHSHAGKPHGDRSERRSEGRGEGRSEGRGEGRSEGRSGGHSGGHSGGRGKAQSHRNADHHSGHTPHAKHQSRHEGAASGKSDHKRRGFQSNGRGKSRSHTAR